MGDIVLKLKEVNLRNVEEKVNKAVHVYCDRLGLESFSVEKRVFSDPFPLNFQGRIQVNLRDVDESNREVKIIKAIARIGETVGCDFLVKSHKYISKEWKDGKWVYKYKESSPHEVKECSADYLHVTKDNALSVGSRFLEKWQEEWGKDGKYCLPLSRKVCIDKISFLHLKKHREGGRLVRRNIDDVARRVPCLPIAKEILESKGTLVERRKKKNYLYETLRGKKDGIYIDVVVSTDLSNKTVYISVFPREMKKSASGDAGVVPSLFRATNHGSKEPLLILGVITQSEGDKSILSKSRESVKRKEAGEEPRYQAQKELISRWNKEAEAATRAAYQYLCFLLDLEPGVKKSLDDLVVDGKLVFDPGNGKPLKKKDLDKLIGTVENFLSRKLLEAEKRLILQSSGLGRYIAMAEKTLPRDIVEKMKLDGIRYHGKTFEEMTRTYEDLKRNFEKATDEDAAKLQFIEESIGNQISRLSQETVFGIKKIYYQSVLERKSKQAVRQELFDTFGALNRSWDRIVRTESSNLINRSYIDSNLEVSKKSYFRRIEGSRNTCDFCKEANGTIALYVDHPLEDDRIEDPAAQIAIWPGKTNVGRTRSEWRIPEGAIHPHCFGTWEKVHDIEIEELTNGIPKTAD